MNYQFLKEIWERIKGLTLNPRLEWEKIKVAKTSLPDLFLYYAVILALVPAISLVIGFSLVGSNRPFSVYQRASVVDSIFAGVVIYFSSLAGVYLLGWLVNFFAANFEAKANLVQAMKVAVYSATPFWLAGFFSIVPALSFLGIIRWYGLYLAYHGLQTLMETPKDKLPGYLVLIIVGAVVVWSAIYSLTAKLLWHPFPFGA